MFELKTGNWKLRSVLPGIAAFLLVLLLPETGFSLPTAPVTSAAHSSKAERHRIEVAFIESNVADYQILVNGIRPEVEVHLLDASQDGLAQMAKLLTGRSGIDAIHLISHGSAASLQLGKLTLSARNLQERSPELKTIGNALNAPADILLYGCSVAQGTLGNEFVDRIARLTGATVAASTNASGAQALGGNWILEKQTGNIAVETAFAEPAMPGYDHLLVLPDGVQDVTPTTLPGSFITGFTLTKNTAGTVIYTDDPIGIYFYDLAAETGPATLTVSADGTNVTIFDLTGFASPFYASSGDTLTVSFTGHTSGGGTPTTSGTVSSANGGALSGANFAAFTSLTSFSFTVTAAISTGDLTWDSFTVANAKLGAAPTATTDSASSIAATGATLNGTVNDNGASTTVTFDYGLTTGYGTNVAATTGGTVFAGAGSTAVAKSLTGLTCNTPYHFRVKGVNSVGTTYGGDQTFTTSPCSYSVTYNGNTNTGGSVPTDGSSPYLSGSTVTVLGNTGTLTKTGYTFAGWNTLANGTGTDYAASATFTMGAADTTLYAQWTINSYTVTYNTDGNGSLIGSTPQIISYLGSATSVTAVPSTNYHFVNWTGTAGFSTTTSNPLIVSSVTATMTITANFSHDAVNGSCGLSSGQTFTTQPVSDLCSEGTSTAMSGTGPWAWTCSGQFGGTTADCAAAIDITGPTLAVSTLADGAITNNATLNVAGTVSDISGVASLTINNASVSINAGSFSYPVTLDTGSNIITSIALDTLGNTTTDTRTIVLGQTAPGVAIAAPADNSVTNSPTVSVNGTTDESATVLISVNSGPTTTAAVSDTSFSLLISLTTNTINTINVYATDLAGHTTSAKRTVTYDDVNPSLAITTPSQDMSTNQSGITLSGTVDDITSGTLLVTCPTASIGLVTNPTSTSWQVDVTNMTTGTNAITVTATDAVNNSTSVMRNVIYDTTPPALTVNPVSTPTNGNSQIITGTRELNSSVTVTCLTAVVSAVTTTDTAWSVSLTNMTEGTNAITVTATDAAGNTTVAETSILLDTTPPTGTIVLNNGAPFTTYATVNVHLDATDSNGVAAYYLAENSTKPGAADPLWSAVTSTLSLISNATFTLSGGDGTKTVHAWFKDLSGNISTGAGASITLDSQAPVTTAAATGYTFGNWTNSGSVSATLSPDDGSGSGAAAGYPKYCVDTTNTCAPSTSYASAFNVTCASGSACTQYVRYQSIDNAGNSETVASSIVNQDLQSPILALSMPANGAITKNPYVTVAGAAKDISGIQGLTINGAAVAVNPGNTFSHLITLTSGTNIITTVATDLAGNQATETRRIILDIAGHTFSATEVPGMVVSMLPDGSHTSDATLNVTGIISDLSDVQEVLVGSDPVLINPDGSFSVAVPLILGDNLVQITIIDKAGNQATVNRTIVLDPLAATLTVTSPADGLTTARNHIDVAGSADVTAVVTVKVNEDSPITAGTGGDFSSTVNLNSGLNTIVFLATSPTRSTQTAKRTVFYDFRKPGLSVTSPDKDITVTNGTVTIAGIVSDALTDVTVTILASGQTYTPALVSNSTFTQDITFAGEGIYPVIITATDENNNSSQVQRNVRYQRGNVVINRGAATTTSTTVTLDLSYVSAPTFTMSTMQLLYNNTAWTAPMAFAAKKTVTLPAGDGVKTVYVRFIDKSGATSAFYSDTIILDTRIPLGTITINNGAAVTTLPSVTLSLAVSDVNGVVKMQFSNNGTTWTASEPFASTKSYTLPGTYGTKKVYVRFIDSAGKISAASDTILYAATTTATTAADVTIKNGDPYTTLTTVPVLITSPTSTQMRISTNGTTWGLWQAIATSKTLAVTLPSGDGVKTVYAQFKGDAATYSDTIILDTVAPKGTIQINDGLYSTNSHTVTLTLTASDLNGVTAMQFSQNNLDWAKQAWMLFSGTTTTTLTAGDGVKTVWVRYKDNAGKISAAYADTIRVDTTAPSGKVLINSGAKIITSLNVTLSLSASGATYMQWHFDDVSWNDNAWEPFAASKKITFPTGDGTKDVYVRFKDLTGNESQFSAHAGVSYTKTQAPAGITVPVSSLVTSYTVTWSKSLTADVTTGVTYLLQEAANDTFTTGLRTAYSGTALHAKITYRTKGHTYYYRVQARKTGYASSDWTTAANGCTVGP